MELGEIKNKIIGAVDSVLGVIGREMDRWDEADRRLGTRVLQELNSPGTPELLAEDLLSVQGRVCHDYGRPGVMERAREMRALEESRWGRKN